MPSEDNKILKYASVGTSLKIPFMFYADLECLLECVSVKIILKNLTQRKKISIPLLGTHCLEIAHLMEQKTNLIITEAEIVRKGFVRT